METSRLPFSMKRLYGGCAVVDGLLLASPENVTLEYRMKDSFVRVLSGPVTIVTIGLSDLEAAECGFGFFSPWIELTARTLNAFDKLPGAHASQLKLRIPWRYRRQLPTFTAELNLFLLCRSTERYRSQLPGPA